MRLAYPDESLQLVLVDGDLEALLAVHRDDGDPDPVVAHKIVVLKGGFVIFDDFMRRDWANFEYQIRRALEATRGNREKAALLLGISRATIYRKIKDLKLR